MTLFPFFEDIEGKDILIVGGGRIALEKYEKLKMFTNRISIVAKESVLTGDFVHIKSFEDSDLEGADICIVATSDRELNKHIAMICKEKNISVNVVDDRELCSFIFPSLVKKGDLCIGISTAGASPLYSKYLREDIEKRIPDNIEDILDRMNHFRQIVPDYVEEQRTRKKVYKEILASLLEDESCSDEMILNNILNKYVIK